MSFYRSIFTVLAACIIASPVLADTALPVPAAVPVKQAVPALAAKINLNLAKTKEFLTVKGLNPAMVRSIMGYRKRHGEFKSLDDLAKVRAISKLTPVELKAIQDQLSL
jgi:competence protein ComEA